MIRSLYVHIPFCVKKCLYCDFNSYSMSSGIQDEYVEYLIKEINSLGIDRFQTIFVGGGTPTILSLESMEKLLKELSKFSPMEFTLEANPGTLDDDKLKLMNSYGVNRLSIGLQAWQDRLLKKLGRIHTLDGFLNSYNMARRHGFNNINIDIMFDIPDQSFEDWIETVEKVKGLKPEHISAYSLIIEEETPFYDMNKKGLLNLVDEENERNMYWFVVESLEAFGLMQYEISNFSIPGYECRHNITYWLNEEYIGVGAGAHSYVSGVRYSNKKGVKSYIEGIKTGNAKENITFISTDDEMSEFMFLGLRMINGICKERFNQRFGVDIYKVYSREIEELKELGLISEKDGFIKLTKKGIDLSNQVFVKFLRG